MASAPPPVGTAIAGLGSAGRTFHAPLIMAVPGLRLVRVSTSRPTDLPGAIAAGSFDDILRDPAVELVVVATPSGLHFDHARAAIAAGKHVVVDKPLATTAEQGRQIVASARSAGRLLTAFHNRRWDGDYRALHALLAAGALGRVTRFESHWDRFRPLVASRWREREGPGSGLLFDLGPHLVDQALQLFGRPEQVSAIVERQRDGALVDDAFCLTLHYPRMIAILSASSLAAAPAPRFRVHGTAGSLEMEGFDPQESQLKAGMSPLAGNFGQQAGGRARIVDADGERELPPVSGDYPAFYRALAAAIRAGSPPPVDPLDAVDGLLVIETALQSAASGRRLDLAAPA